MAGSDTFAWRESRYLKVALTDEELIERGVQLARLVRERTDAANAHAVEKRRMKDEIDGFDGRIGALSGVVNSGMEERSVQVELRWSPILNIIEEIRIDTGEVIKTRAPGEDDKVRLSQLRQMTIGEAAQEPSDEGGEKA